MARLPRRQGRGCGVSDTPRTDELSYAMMRSAINHDLSREAIVFAFEGFARTLERENAAMREAIREAHEAIVLSPYPDADAIAKLQPFLKP